MKEKIKLEGILNTPAIRKKEQERISGKSMIIPTNFEKVMKDGIIKSENIPAPDFSNAELQDLRAKVVQLSQENESLKAENEKAKEKYEKITGPKEKIKARFEELEKEISDLKAENENLKSDLKEFLDNQEVNNGSSSDRSEE